jgi:hypothetical protein
MQIQDPQTERAPDPRAVRQRSIARARRRLHRLKLASVTASVLTFGGLTAGLAIQGGISGQAVASATTTTSGGTAATKVSTSVSTAATATPTGTATATPTTTQSAPIVSAQS